MKKIMRLMSRVLALSLVFTLVFPHGSYAAAVPFDGSGGANNIGNLSYSITIASGAKILLVGVGAQSTSVATVTANGIALDVVNNTLFDSGSDRITVYRLLNPPSGSVTIDVTGIGSVFQYSTAVSYTGGGEYDASAVNTAASATSLTCTVSTTVAESFTVMFMALSNSSQPAAGTGSTLRVSNGSPGISGFDSGNTITVPGSTNMQGTFGSQQAGCVIVSIPPAAQASAAPIKKTPMGGVSAGGVMGW